MPIFNYLSPNIADYPILYPTINNNNWVSTDGEICTPSNEELIELLANENPPLICHRKWTEKKIGIKLNKSLDILELFAFVKPAEFCIPNPSGLAIATGLARPKTNIDKTIFLRTIAQYLLDNLSEFAIDNPEKNSLKLEYGYSDQVAKDLIQKGHEVVRPDQPIGGAQAIIHDL